MWIVLLVFFAVILWDFCEVFFQSLICTQSRTQCYGRSKRDSNKKKKKEEEEEEETNTEIKEEERKQAESGLEKVYHLVKESSTWEKPINGFWFFFSPWCWFLYFLLASLKTRLFELPFLRVE